MPFDRKRYPQDWEQIRARVLERAHHKCEYCGVANGAWGYRDREGKFYPVSKERLIEAGWKNPPFRIASTFKHTDRDVVHPVKIIRIVLTIAHVDPETKHDKMDCRDEALKALCQRCHLLEDLDEHMQRAAITREHKRLEAAAEAGQSSLF